MPSEPAVPRINTVYQLLFSFEGIDSYLLYLALIRWAQGKQYVL